MLPPGITDASQLTSSATSNVPLFKPSTNFAQDRPVVLAPAAPVATLAPATTASVGAGKVNANTGAKPPKPAGPPPASAFKNKATASIGNSDNLTKSSGTTV